jgi:hypothetical protein
MNNFVENNKFKMRQEDIQRNLHPAVVCWDTLLCYGTVNSTESCNQPIVKYHIPIKNLASNERFVLLMKYA